MTCPKCDENQGRGECEDHPLVTIEEILGWAWGFFEALGIIMFLLSILWIAGRIH